MYRAFAEGPLAMPVIAGEKPEHERFPGADATYSIEAMMQDGKALQAGTSHYLGTTFAEAAGIRYQDREGGLQPCHTTSWGVSTRLIGGVIMTHGDDDGLRCPPRIAPRQVVIIPMLRDTDEDEKILDYCHALAADLRGSAAFGEPVRALLDAKAAKAAGKRWAWVKKGAPVIVEVGPRDVAARNVAVLRRDRLYKEDGKLATAFLPRDEFVGGVSALLEDIQHALFSEAKARLDAGITRDVTDLAGHFGHEDRATGWVEVQWSRPTGEVLDRIVESLKALKLTVRNAPLDAAPADGACHFTGAPAVERILIGRTY
jgi:prolyl-tRNA synthetase